MKRINSIDFLRGLVMVIMALDHTRDLMHINALTANPTDLATTTPVLFFTRWVTHLCAPAFIFLSGVSAFISYQKQDNKSANRLFLLKRGMWLILLEFTIINFGIWFDTSFGILMSQVIGAIGFGLIMLSILTCFSANTIGVIGLIIIFGHNLLANVNFPQGTMLHYVWGYLFKMSFWQFPSRFIFFVNYPLIPWLGIMLAGYGFGRYMQLPDAKRRRIILQFALSALSIFVILRTFNFYGDSQLWSCNQKSWMYSIMSFMNVNKYPPSLLFVCSTLGISFLLLYIFEGRNNLFTHIMTVYGKVPLFYYLIHWYILHSFMLSLMIAQGYHWSELNFEPFNFGRPKQGGGVGLLGVYLIWISAVAALYPLCVWFGRYKDTHRDKKWLRYI